MLTEVAFVVDHVRVELWPEVMVVGLALNVTVGAGVVETVTVAVAVLVPPAPVAVRVYVVVAVGETVTEPDVGTVPTPLSILTVVALVVDHDKVEV